MASNPDKITHARTRLLLTQPFFGALSLRMKLVKDSSIDTACTNGEYIKYNPDFVEKLPTAQVLGLLAHEVMHPAFLHHTRMGHRDAKRWNIACDFAINGILLGAKFELPPGALHNPAWADKAAEEIYNLLPNDPNELQQRYGNGNDPGGCGGVEPAPGSQESDSVRAQAEADWKVALAAAAYSAKQQGNLPAGLDRLIEATLEPQANWRQELQRFCNTPIPADVSWKRPNRRFVHSGSYLPSRDTKLTGTFVCVIDTSGSIGDAELNAFGSEIKGIKDQLQPERTIVMYCDADVNMVEEFAAHDELTFKAVGGGGTDFRPPFQWLEDRDIKPDALVYLTDGYGCFPEESDVTFPTLWAINNKSVVPPFGVHVEIEP